MKWSGDVDLNDGELQRMYATYMNRLKFVSRIGLDDRVSLLQDISTCIGELCDDIKFVSSGKDLQ